MSIDECKAEIHKMVDEIMNMDFILKIYSVSKVLYYRFKEG